MSSDSHENSESDRNTWSALGSEIHEWDSCAGFDPVSVYQASAMKYDASVSSMIADLTPAADREVGVVAEEASRELSRFDAELCAQLAGFGPVLLRSEAAS